MGAAMEAEAAGTIEAYVHAQHRAEPLAPRFRTPKPQPKAARSSD